jgi:hypothetical protein
MDPANQDGRSLTGPASACGRVSCFFLRVFDAGDIRRCQGSASPRYGSVAFNKR